MKLIEMGVENFRSLRGEEIKVSFENSDIIFLFGQNNTGKSALLSAYEFLVTPNKKAVIGDFYEFNIQNQIEITALFRKEEGDNEEFEEKGLHKWVNKNDLIKFRKRWVNTEDAGKKETWSLENNKFVEDGFGGFEQHFTHQAPTPIRIPAFPSIDDLTKWIKKVVKDKVLKNLKAEEANVYTRVQEEFKELQDKIFSKEAVVKLVEEANSNFKKVFPELSLGINPVEGSEIDLTKSLEADFSVTIEDSRYPDVKQEFVHHGHGVIRQTMFNFLGVVRDTYSKKGRKNFIILFEEPEIYLHPKSIKAMRNLLYEICTESEFQIFCSSHSPNLIDITKPQTSLVRLVRNENGNTSLFQVGDNIFANNAEKKQQVQMMNRFNPDVCESFFSDEVILVEGDTEAIVCRFLLATRYSEKDIYVLNTGSKNNIPFFQEIFTHFNIKQHIIHDSDTRYRYEKKKKDNGQVEYKVKEKTNGEKAENSAWTLNETIWNKIIEANKLQQGLTQRYVSIYDFESANNYEHDTEKGKPLSAYEFAQNINGAGTLEILEFIKQIVGEKEKEKEYTQEELDEIVKEPI